MTAFLKWWWIQADFPVPRGPRIRIDCFGFYINLLIIGKHFYRKYAMGQGIFSAEPIWTAEPLLPAPRGGQEGFVLTVKIRPHR